MQSADSQKTLLLSTEYVKRIDENGTVTHLPHGEEMWETVRKVARSNAIRTQKHNSKSQLLRSDSSRQTHWCIGLRDRQSQFM